MNKTIIADLHNHSSFSDGEYLPEQLVLKASQLGLKAVGLTDHDTIDGLKEALYAGGKYQIEVIPGIEVSIRFKRSFFTGTLHVLLYFSPNLIDNIEFQNDIKTIIGKGRGVELTKTRVNSINKEFGPEGKNPYLPRKLLPEELLNLCSNASRRHFAIAFEKNFKIADKKAITMLIGNNSPSYIPSGIELSNLKTLIEKYQVVTVLAHPAAGSFPGESHYKEVHPPLAIVEKLIPDFINPQIFGLDGIEIYYPAHTKQLRNTLFNWAKRYNLIITGGSDCHDTLERPVGIEGVNIKELDILKNRIYLKNLP